MDVKLSKDEIKLIAAEVVRQLGASGSTLKGAAGVSTKAAGKPFTAISVRKSNGLTAADGSQLFGIDAAAEEVSQHPNTIRRHIKSGKLKAKMINGSYQIKQRDLERYARS